MRKLLGTFIVVALMAGLVVAGSGQVPAHVCEKNPNHRHCQSTTITTSTTTTSTTSTTISTTTTTIPPSSTRTLLWVGNKISDWFSTANSGGGTQWNISPGGVEQYNPALDGSTNHGARLNHQGFGTYRVLPTEAWYSVEVFVPTYQGAQNNVFQFKQGNGTTREHLWNIGWRPDGKGNLQGIIRTRLKGDQWANSNLSTVFLNWNVPIGEWFTVEVFRRISTSSDGGYEVRMNGVLVYEFSGPTAASNLTPRSHGNHEWVVSHYLGRGYYTDGAVPATSILFRNAKIEG